MSVWNSIRKIHDLKNKLGPICFNRYQKRKIDFGFRGCCFFNWKVIEETGQSSASFTLIDHIFKDQLGLFMVFSGKYWKLIEETGQISASFILIDHIIQDQLGLLASSFLSVCSGMLFYG